MATKPHLCCSQVTRGVVFTTMVMAATIRPIPIRAGVSLGLAADIVAEAAEPGSFPFVHGRQAAPLFVDKADYPGVLRAAGDLQADVERVTGVKPDLVTDRAPAGKAVVIAGTLGRS